MMAKKIAIVTGASGGIGHEFVKLLVNEDINEIWVIARNVQKLDKLQEEFQDKIVVYALDLTLSENISLINAKIISESVDIRYLINSAGIGRGGLSVDFSLEEISEHIEISVTAIVKLCNICIPYMSKGAHIINLSSQSAFQPLPYLNLYAASKAFVRNYSRALNVELKNSGISVTAVCPGWVDTNLLVEKMNGHKVNYFGLVAANRVAYKALKDAKSGKDMSVFSINVKTQHVLTKIVPQKIVMKVWCSISNKFFK